MTNAEITIALDTLGLIISTLAFTWFVDSGNKPAIYTSAVIVLLFIRNLYGYL